VQQKKKATIIHQGVSETVVLDIFAVQSQSWRDRKEDRPSMMLRQVTLMAKQEAVTDQSLHATLRDLASREALAAPWYKTST